MSSENPDRRNRERRPSIFFPILLIAIGVYFLLINLGAVPGNFWSTLWRLWPVLFIAGGLEGFIRRENLVTNSLFVVLGTVFLLCNFGYLHYSVLELILLLWPILLVALGFDILIGKRSIWISLAGVGIFLVILFGVLLYVGGGAQAGEVVLDSNISQPLEGAEMADYDLGIGAGVLKIDPLASDTLLIEGSIPSSGDITVNQSYAVEEGTGFYRLNTEGAFSYAPGTDSKEWNWIFRINQEILSNFKGSLGAGEATLTLSDLSLESLSFDLGAGQVTVYLPDTGDYSGAITTAVGTLTIYVPEGLEVRIQSDTALTAFSAPSGYQKEGNVYTSPGYSDSSNRADLKISNVIGTVVITEK
jgi:LiaF transmembrane domain